MAYVFRAQLRRRWSAWIAMGAVLGVVAGAVMAMAIGAMRTESANDRFLESSRAFDVGFPLLCGLDDPVASAATAGPSARAQATCLREIRALPHVEDALQVSQLGQVVVTDDGRSTQPGDDSCYSGPGSVLLVVDPAGRLGTEINRFRLLEGRLPAATAPREVVIAPEMAERLDLHPGDELSAYPDADCDEDPAGLEPFALEIVGVGVAPYVARPPSGEYTNLVVGSPALLQGLSPVDREQIGLVTLEHGAAGVDEFLDAARGIGVPVDAGFQRQSTHADAVERGLRPQAVALALVALLAGLAAAAVLGAALYRQTAVDTTDDPALSVLGVTPAQLLWQGTARGAVIAAVTIVTAAATAYLLSGSVSSGLARLVDPQPGRRLDAGPILLGTMAAGAAIVGVAVLGSWFRRRARRPDAEVRTHRASRIAGRAAAMGWPPTVVSGIRMALERDRGPRAVPVVSSMVGVLVGLTILVGTVTFSASLQHLLHTPRDVGWNWDVGVAVPTEDPSAAAVVIEAFEGHPDVVGAATGSFYGFASGGLGVGASRQSVALLAFGPGTVGPTVLEGRAAQADGEIALGPETLTDLDLAIGDEVDLAVVNEGAIFAGPPARSSAPYEIVGTAVLPIAGGESRLGRGAATTIEGIRRLFPEAAAEVVWLRLRPGAGPEPVVSEVAADLGIDSPAATDVVTLAGLGDSLIDVRGVDSLPLVLAGLVGLMAAGVMAHVVVTSARARRRDLALLRTIGFTRRQVRATVAWQATVMGGSAVLLSIPLGVAAGRAAWTLFASDLGVLPEPVVPIAWLAVTAVTVVAGANLVALVPAWSASRDRPAGVLRAE